MKALLFRLALIPCIVAAAGCASIEPTIQSNSPPETTSGYISGTFTRTNSGGFAFAITNLQTNHEYGLPLGEDTSLPSNVDRQVITIKVPPGRYVVSNWYTYGTLNRAKNGTNKITNRHLAMPFDVSANSVHYLGQFMVTTTQEALTTHWQIQPQGLTVEQARSAFGAAHPMFSVLQFSCQLCLD